LCRPAGFLATGHPEKQNGNLFPRIRKLPGGRQHNRVAVERDGKIVTGKGAGIAIRFALKIVEMFKGADFAEELAGKMIVQ
jgi:4-methyl-5(b-hydroxyethyl)-thiazole monophosphate biosynthesis